MLARNSFNSDVSHKIALLATQFVEFLIQLPIRSTASRPAAITRPERPFRFSEAGHLLLSITVASGLIAGDGDIYA